jgi:hypothetical protein
MARIPRSAAPDTIYHVINRANESEKGSGTFFEENNPVEDGPRLNGSE